MCRLCLKIVLIVVPFVVLVICRFCSNIVLIVVPFCRARDLSLVIEIVLPRLSTQTPRRPKC